MAKYSWGPSGLVEMAPDEFIILQQEGAVSLNNSIQSIQIEQFLGRAKTQLNNYQRIFKDQIEATKKALENEGLVAQSVFTHSDIQLESGTGQDKQTIDLKGIFEQLFAMKKSGGSWSKWMGSPKGKVEGSLRPWLKQLSESVTTPQELKNKIDTFLTKYSSGASRKEQSSALGFLIEALATKANYAILQNNEELLKQLQEVGILWLSPEGQQKKAETIIPNASDIVLTANNGIQLNISVKFRTPSKWDWRAGQVSEHFNQWLVGNTRNGSSVGNFFEKQGYLNLTNKTINMLELMGINFMYYPEILRPSKRKLEQLAIIDSLFFIFLGVDWSRAFEIKEQQLKKEYISFLPDVISSIEQSVSARDALTYTYMIMEQIAKGQIGQKEYGESNSRYSTSLGDIIEVSNKFSFSYFADVGNILPLKSPQEVTNDDKEVQIFAQTQHDLRKAQGRAANASGEETEDLVTIAKKMQEILRVIANSFDIGKFIPRPNVGGYLSVSYHILMDNILNFSKQQQGAK